MCELGTCYYCVNAIIKKEHEDSNDLVKNIYPVICNLDDSCIRETTTYRLNHECHHVK